jgi:hypothetical protein
MPASLPATPLEAAGANTQRHTRAQKLSTDEITTAAFVVGGDHSAASVPAACHANPMRMLDFAETPLD